MPVALTKAELIERATRWGAKRKVMFRESLLDEWIKKGLVVDDDRHRGYNHKKRPTYRYGCRYYRRILQVLRLYSRGIKSADQIFIMLFLNGGGVRPFEVREPITREFARARAKVNAQARSVQFDQAGSIPPKHKDSLVRSLGQADERFLAAKIVLPGEQMIEIMRAARNPDPESARRKIPSAETIPVAMLQSLVGGLLAVDGGAAGEAERLLLAASNSELETARSTLLDIRKVFSSGLIASNKVALEPLRDAFSVALAQPEFVAVQLVQMIRLAGASGRLPFEELLQAYGFTIDC